MNKIFKSALQLMGILLLIIPISCSLAQQSNMETKNNLANNCDADLGICVPIHNIGNKTKNEMSIDRIAKVKLTYYYDALCGWCYGFSPVMSKLEQAYGDRISIEVISGGLFLGSRAGRINDVAPHIRSGAFKSVEARTGVKFGEEFLTDVFGAGQTILNSLPPTIALCVVKEEQPLQGLKFAEMLIKAVYFDGLNPIDLDGLASYAEKLGFDRAAFRAKLEEDKYRIAAEKEFELFARSQFGGMPTLVVEKGGEQHLLSNGYLSYEAIALKLESIFDNKN